MMLASNRELSAVADAAQRTVWLPPALTIRAQIAAGLVFGWMGVVLAAPLTAVALGRLTRDHLRRPRSPFRPHDFDRHGDIAAGAVASGDGDKVSGMNVVRSKVDRRPAGTCARVVRPRGRANELHGRLWGHRDLSVHDASPPGPVHVIISRRTSPSCVARTTVPECRSSSAAADGTSNGAARTTMLETTARIIPRLLLEPAGIVLASRRVLRALAKRPDSDLDGDAVADVDILQRAFRHVQHDAPGVRLQREMAARAIDLNDLARCRIPTHRITRRCGRAHGGCCGRSLTARRRRWLRLDLDVVHDLLHSVDVSRDLLGALLLSFRRGRPAEVH